jgi:hypothetical protein
MCGEIVGGRDVGGSFRVYPPGYGFCTFMGEAALADPASHATSEMPVHGVIATVGRFRSMIVGPRGWSWSPLLPA